jgi:ATP-independent RNA helicase DbpA
MQFSNLPLSSAMVHNLEAIGYTQMTPIQEQSLPHILQNKDVLAKAQTGSGKTAAFGIGLLHKLNVKKFRVQSLVLCPTRELADQVAKELRVIAKFQHNIKILMLTGGESFGKQLGSLAHQAHIVVGTPGRVLKHLNKGSLQLNDLEVLVLDEADRMLDMGFIEEVESILAFMPPKKQRLLFSATYEDEILKISQKIQNNPVKVEVTPTQTLSEIEELFLLTNHKEQSLLDVMCHYDVANIIVFCNTKIKTQEIAEFLQKNQIDALALHGDLEQYERNDVLVQFANGSCRVLVATDVAARGLDIKALSMVINYDLPNTQEIYTHRIGRTARAGAKGIAISLYEEHEKEVVQEYTQREGVCFVDEQSFELKDGFSMKPDFITLVIEGGKKDKLRAGDILGALTATQALIGDDIGKIDLYDRQAYVAIKANKIDQAHKLLQNSKIKAKKFSAWIL